MAMDKAIKKILVPIDGSKASQKAIEYSIKLAKSLDAHIHLFNVIDIEKNDYHDDPSEDESRLNSARYLLEDAENIVKENMVEVSTETAIGIVPEIILSTAKENDFDLIVMGSRGMSGHEYPMLGHVSEKVAMHAHCPVVLV